MTTRTRWLALAALIIPASALAAPWPTMSHPEEFFPDDMPALTSGGPYADLLRQVQTKLHEQGFNAGPVSGDFTTKTQAAIAQFQISRMLPASGMLDDATLHELGVLRDVQPDAGGKS